MIQLERQPDEVESRRISTLPKTAERLIEQGSRDHGDAAAVISVKNIPASFFSSAVVASNGQ